MMDGRGWWAECGEWECLEVRAAPSPPWTGQCARGPYRAQVGGCPGFKLLVFFSVHPRARYLCPGTSIENKMTLHGGLCAAPKVGPASRILDRKP